MLQKQSQNCHMLIDLKMENRCRVRKDQGLWKCNYFYRMDYSFFTITNLKSSLKSKKIRISLYFAAEPYSSVSIAFLIPSRSYEFMKR